MFCVGTKREIRGSGETTVWRLSTAYAERVVLTWKKETDIKPGLHERFLTIYSKSSTNCGGYMRDKYFDDDKVVSSERVSLRK